MSQCDGRLFAQPDGTDLGPVSFQGRDLEVRRTVANDSAIAMDDHLVGVHHMRVLGDRQCRSFSDFNILQTGDVEGRLGDIEKLFRFLAVSSGWKVG